MRILVTTEEGYARVDTPQSPNPGHGEGNALEGKRTPAPEATGTAPLKRAKLSSRSGPARIEAAERMRKAVQLRGAGMAFDDIARECGYTNRGAAYKAVMRAMRDIYREPTREMRELELQRIDAQEFRVTRHVVTLSNELVTNKTLKPHEREYQRILDTMLRGEHMLVALRERRARFLGLDAARPVGGRGGASDTVLPPVDERIEPPPLEALLAFFDYQTTGPPVDEANGGSVANPSGSLWHGGNGNGSGGNGH